MLIFIILVFSIYVALTMKMFHSMLSANMSGNRNEGKGPIPALSNKWLLYLLYLLHLSACASLMLAAILVEIDWLDLVRVAFIYGLAGEAVSFIPVFLIHPQQI